jgi:DNA-binding HxlR family transcriptional regulator
MTAADSAPTQARTTQTTRTTRPTRPLQQDDVCRTSEVLDIVGDKWSLLVVRNLSTGPRRFTELKRAIDGISQRMLTVTLRSLERDGILTRTVRNVMPPHVSYELTPMGQTLREATAPLLEWTPAPAPRPPSRTVPAHLPRASRVPGGPGIHGTQRTSPPTRLRSVKTCGV